MKKYLFLLLLISAFVMSGKAQNTTGEITETTERLKAATQQLELDAKAKTQEATDLRKQAMVKKLQAIKDKAASATLKTEAFDLEQKAKTKLEEATILRKQVADNRKQLTELTKQNNPKTPAIINPSVTKNITPAKPNIILGDYIEIFELPNYQGKSVKYKINTENNFLNIPFSSNNISIKFSNEEKIILYVAMESTKTIRTFLNSFTNLNMNASDIASIIVGTKRKLEIDFNGIIYDYNPTPRGVRGPGIHNSDCKKIYGTLDYKLEMKMKTKTGFAKTTLFPIGEPIDRNADGKINVFNLPKYKEYAYPYVYDEGNGAELTPKTKRRNGNSFVSSENILFSVPDELPNARKYFYVDSNSYPFNRATVINKKYSFTTYVKIGSAHKQCNICTDFTWDVEMKTRDEIKVDLSYDVQHGYKDSARQTPYLLDFIQIGPFRSNEQYTGGLRTKRDNHTGPQHATYIQFTTKLVKP